MGGGGDSPQHVWHWESSSRMSNIGPTIGRNSNVPPTSLARVTPVWKNRGLVTALHTTSSDCQNLYGSGE